MLARLRSAYRTIVPEVFRRTLRHVFTGTEREYSAEYFRQLDAWQQASYPVVAESIVELFHPESVIDFGCGSGALLAELQLRGVRGQGLDVHEPALRICRQRGLEVIEADLTSPLQLNSEADLCICLEVAEHLPPESAAQLVRNLASGPSRLLFSAATPGQGGHHHLNERPHDYWIDLLGKAGMRLDLAATEKLRQHWNLKGVVPWYTRNLLVFQRRE